MNRFSDITQFFKFYSLPLLAVVIAFGLYYAVFEAAHLLRNSSKIEAPECMTIFELPKPSAQDNTPLTFLEPEAPLPQEPHAPNLTQVSTPITTPSPTPQPQEKSPELSLRFIVNTDVLNIREAPSLNAPVIERKGRSEVLLVSEIKSEWGRIPKGWVYTKLLTPAP